MCHHLKLGTRYPCPRPVSGVLSSLSTHAHGQRLPSFNAASITAEFAASFSPSSCISFVRLICTSRQLQPCDATYDVWSCILFARRAPARVVTYRLRLTTCGLHVLLVNSLVVATTCCIFHSDKLSYIHVRCRSD